jgi:hypothetical protein
VTDPPDQQRSPEAILARIDDVLEESKELTKRHREVLNELDALLAELEQALVPVTQH